MDRTYWALALGCNQAILDAVQREWFRQRSLADTFLTIVQCLNTVGMKHPDVDSGNYEMKFDALCREVPWGELYWRFPGYTLILEVYSGGHFRLCESPGPRYWPEELLIGDGRDWIYRLPAILDKLKY